MSAAITPVYLAYLSQRLTAQIVSEAARSKLDELLKDQSLIGDQTERWVAFLFDGSGILPELFELKTAVRRSFAQRSGKDEVGAHGPRIGGQLRRRLRQLPKPTRHNDPGQSLRAKFVVS